MASGLSFILPTSIIAITWITIVLHFACEEDTPSMSQVQSARKKK